MNTFPTFVIIVAANTDVAAAAAAVAFFGVRANLVENGHSVLMIASFGLNRVCIKWND